MPAKASGSWSISGPLGKDGIIITPYAPDVFGASIVSNEYVGGKGIITFDGEVTSIGYSAFYACSGLTSLDIPNSVTSIGISAFNGCSGLTSIDIPNSVTSIGSTAFGACRGLTSIKVYALTPPTLETKVFESTNSCPIYVPAQSVDAYKTADGWSEYADTWSSSNTDVATVSNSGVVSAKAVGNATITVMTVDGNKVATCSVKVNAAVVPVTGVSFNSASVTMTEGESLALVASVTPSNATNQSLTGGG